MKTSKQGSIHRTVVVLFLQKGSGKDPDSLLLGESLNRFCKGYVIPPGGHIEPGDDACKTAMHESADEVGLSPVSGSLQHVGTFEVRYEDLTRVHMEFLMTSRWTGDLKPNAKDFAWARFIPLTELSSVQAQMPPGDPAFLASILGGFFTRATMWCGKDLKEVKEFKMKSIPIP